MAEEATLVYLDGGAKRTFAGALEWPGWARAGKGDEAALEALASYLPRYRAVAERAGLVVPESAADAFEVVEHLPASANTDFGALGGMPAHDTTPLSEQQAAGLAAILQAAWDYLDEVAAGAPPELRKGPRGGGRDRDKVVEHVISAELAYVRKVGVPGGKAAGADDQALARTRAAVLEALRGARSGEPLAPNGWTARYAARRFTWHVLDHAWEIEDRSVG